MTSFRLAPLARLALRLPDADDARCVRPTSASPHSYYEHLRLVGSRLVMGLSPHPRTGNTVFHDTAIRFGGSVDFFCAGGVLFPTANRRDRASDVPVASPELWRRFRTRQLCRGSLDRTPRNPREGTTAFPIRDAFHR